MSRKPRNHSAIGQRQHWVGGGEPNETRSCVAEDVYQTLCEAARPRVCGSAGRSASRGWSDAAGEVVLEERPRMAHQVPVVCQRMRFDTVGPR